MVPRISDKVNSRTDFMDQQAACAELTNMLNYVAQPPHCRHWFHPSSGWALVNSKKEWSGSL